MWICLNKAFLSIVATKAGDTHLLVRARRKGDIERVFPGHKATTIDRRDYQFRADIPREEVAKAIADSLMAIDYGNFKDSVKDNALHDAYARTWNTMARPQPKAPYSVYSDKPRATK